MSDNKLLKRIADTLERIANSLDRIEAILEEKPINGNGNVNINKTLEIKETRQLMQDIVSHYKNTEPFVNIEIGTKLHIFRFRDTIAKIRNIKNTKFEHRRLIKWIRKLEEYQFIKKTNANMFEVLDTGRPWEELQ